MEPAARSLEAAWAMLWAQLQVRAGFWLAIVETHSVDQARELERRTRAVLARSDEVLPAINAATPGGLVDTSGVLLSDATADEAGRWVTGLPVGGADLDEWADAWSELVVRLNRRRATLLDNDRGLVLVGPTPLIMLIRDHAPDLFRFARLTLTVAAPSPVSAIDDEVQGRPSGPTEAGEQHAVVTSDALVEICREPARPLPGALAAVVRDLVRAGDSPEPLAGLVEQADRLVRDNADRAIVAGWHAVALGAVDSERTIERAVAAASFAEPLGEALGHQVVEIIADSAHGRQALKAAMALVSLAQDLRDRYGDTPQTLRDLSISHNKVGDTATAQGDLTTANTHYHQSLQLAQDLRDRYGDTPQTLRDLAVSHNSVGDTATAQGDLTTANTHYQRAVELMTRVVETVPDIASYRLELAYLEAKTR